MQRSFARLQTFALVVTALAATLTVMKLLGFSLSAGESTGLAFFGGLAMILELWSVPLRYFDAASPAFAVYLAAMALFGGPAGILLGLCLVSLRVAFLGRGGIWIRLMEWGSRMLPLALAGAIYDGLNHDAALFTVVPGPLGHLAFNGMTLLHWLAAYLCYQIFQVLISTTAMGLIDQAVQREWSKIQWRITVYNLAAVPMGLLAVFLYQADPAWMWVALLPFLALRGANRLIVQEVAVADQESLEFALRSSRQQVDDLEHRHRQLTVDLSKKVDELSILSEMGLALGASVSLSDTLDIVISMIKRLVVYQSCVIFLAERQGVSAARYVTPYREILEMAPLLQVEESVVNLVLQNRKPLLAPDMQTIAEHRIFKDERCVMVVPLIVQNDIIGAIYVGTVRPNTYNEDHQYGLTLLATAAAIAIKSAQLYQAQEGALTTQVRLNEQLDGKVRQISALLEMGQALASSLHLDNTLNIIVTTMQKLLPHQSCIIFMQDRPGEQSEFRARSFTSPYGEYFKNLTFSPDEGVLGWVYKHRKPLLLEDTRQSVLPSVMEYERAVMCVPMVAENACIGLLYVGAAAPQSFLPEHLSLISTVAYQAAMAIQNAQLYDRMTTLAITDGVTGLYTHRYFQERLAEELTRAERYGGQISLVMIDTDHFKQYNDTLGHPEGDKLLREIAEILRSYTRESDLVCRYGGDEFALVLLDTSKANAVKKAENIREGFELRLGHLPVKVTASIGVSAYPDDGMSKVDLVTAADVAMYQSKDNGRNRVTAAGSSSSVAVP